MKERRASQKLSSKSIMDPNQNVKCKIVVVGDSQCGKTALLHVFAKDCFPEVSVTCSALRGAAGGVPQSGRERPLAVIFLFKVSLTPSRSPQPHCSEGKVPWKPVGWDVPAPWALGPSKLAGSGVASWMGKPGWALGRELRV